MSSPTTIDQTGFHLAVGPNGETGFSGWLSFWTAGYQAIYGSTVDTDPDSPDGQWLALLAQNSADNEQRELQVYLGRSPAGAVGAGLSRLVGLNGIARKAPQYSTAPVTLGGTVGATIPAGSQIGSKSDPTIPAFVTMAPYTIGGGGTVTGTAICTSAGPVNVAVNDLTVIQTVIPGWTSVTNTAPSTPGMSVEQDVPLRARRAQSVAMPSQSMLDGIFGALSNLPGVNPGGVAVYENRTSAPDPLGKSLPPHSIHAVVSGGNPADIANAIWTKATMGVTLVGSQSYTLTDEQGEPQTMYWDIPSSMNVYVTVHLGVPTGSTLSSAAAAAIQNAIWNYGNSVAAIGKNIAWADLFSPINALGLTGQQGLPSITSIALGGTPGPTLQQDLIVPYNALPHFGAAPASGQIVVVSP